MKIIAFAGSNGSKSINNQLINFVAGLQENIATIQLNTFEAPIYNMDIEENEGIPVGIKTLDETLATAEALVISVPEHNGNLSAFFKNHIDWLSRNNRNFLENKKILLLSTSPGPGGAQSALQIAEKTLPYFKGQVIESISVPSFYDNFKDGKLENKEIENAIVTALKKLV